MKVDSEDQREQLLSVISNIGIGGNMEQAEKTLEALKALKAAVTTAEVENVPASPGGLLAGQK